MGQTFRQGFQNCLLPARATFWCKILFLKRLYNLVFQFFWTLSKVFVLLEKLFPNVRQILSPRVPSNIFREHRFFEKTKLFKSFRNSSDSFWILAGKLWQSFLDCILRVDEKDSRFCSKNLFSRCFRFLNDFPFNFFSAFRGRLSMVRLQCNEKYSDVEEPQKNYFFKFKLWGKFFHTFGKHFPAVLSKLHSTFPEGHLGGVFYRKKNILFCHFQTFGNRSWAFHPKNFRPGFENCHRYVQSNILRKNCFFKNYKLLSIFACWAKTTQIFGKSHRYGT